MNNPNFKIKKYALTESTSKTHLHEKNEDLCKEMIDFRPTLDKT